MCLRHAEVTGKPARARGAAASQAAASSEPSCQPVMADSSTEVTGVAPGGLDGVSSQACRARAGNISRNRAGLIPTAMADGRVAAELACV